MKRQALIRAIKMAKYYGQIGYAEEKKIRPGVTKEDIIVKSYYGDAYRSQRQLVKGEGVNDDVQVNNQISVIADAYAEQHIFAIRYITWQGQKWRVSSCEVQRPRLILTLGGLYHV